MRNDKKDAAQDKEINAVADIALENAVKNEDQDKAINAATDLALENSYKNDAQDKSIDRLNDNDIETAKALIQNKKTDDDQSAAIVSLISDVIELKRKVRFLNVSAVTIAFLLAAVLVSKIVM